MEEVKENNISVLQADSAASQGSLFPLFQLQKELSVFESIKKDIQKEKPLISFIGPSGSGKSTLINYLSGQSFSLEQSNFGFPVAVSLDKAEVSSLSRWSNFQVRELSSESGSDERMRLKFEISASTSYALMVVLDYPSLIAGKGVFLSAALELLSDIFKDVQSNTRLRPIIFVTMKAPKEFGEEAFHRLLDVYFQQWEERLVKILSLVQLASSPVMVLEANKHELESIKNKIEFVSSTKESFALMVANIFDLGESRVHFFERIDPLLSVLSIQSRFVLTKLRIDLVNALSQFNKFFQFYRENKEASQRICQLSEGGYQSQIGDKEKYFLTIQEKLKKIEENIRENTEILHQKDTMGECIFCTIEKNESDSNSSGLKSSLFWLMSNESVPAPVRATVRGVLKALPASFSKFSYILPDNRTPRFLRVEVEERQGWEMVAEHIVPSGSGEQGSCYWHIKWSGFGEGVFKVKVFGERRVLYQLEIQKLRQFIHALQEEEISLRWEIKRLKDESLVTDSFEPDKQSLPQAIEKTPVDYKSSDQELRLQHAAEQWLEQSKEYLFSLRALALSFFTDLPELRDFASFLNNRWPSKDAPLPMPLLTMVSTDQLDEKLMSLRESLSGYIQGHAFEALVQEALRSIQSYSLCAGVPIKSGMLHRRAQDFDFLSQLISFLRLENKIFQSFQDAWNVFKMRKLPTSSLDKLKEDKQVGVLDAPLSSFALRATAADFPRLKADTVLQKKPCYLGLFDNEQITFEEDYLAADGSGDCGLHGLGVSREKAIELLLDNKNNKDIRDLVSPEIMAAAIEGELPVSLKQNKMMQALLKTFYEESRGSKESKMGSQARENLLRYCSDLVVYDTFIRDYLGKGGWLTYNRSTDIRQTSSIDALAKLRQIRVYIWQKSEKDTTTVQLVHDSETSDRNGAVHLLHTAGGTHYNLLSMPTLTLAPRQAD